MRSRLHKGLSALALCLNIAVAGSACACTRILWNDNKFGVITGRTMDWPESTEPTLIAFPRGTQRNGGVVGGASVDSNPAKWRAKYGSMVVSIYGIGTADGFNEVGLGAHMLFLEKTDFGPRNPTKPAVHAGLWAQYVLDQAGSVGEALELLKDVQIVMAQAHGHQATVHLALEDASGDSAIIEFIDGKPVAHHGGQYRVMTNDPTYDQQLALLKSQDFSKPSSDAPLPGNVNPVDRFQRAAYFLALLPEPKDEREAIAGVLAIARNVSVPFGAPYDGFGVYNTEYRTAMDLTHRRYYFELSNSPNVIWADLAKFDLSPGAPVMILDPNDVALSGDVSKKFRKEPKAPF